MSNKNTPLLQPLHTSCEIEAWYEMITCVYNFLSASTSLATTLEKTSILREPVQHSGAPLLIKDINEMNQQSNKITEVNLEDFPWFVDELSNHINIPSNINTTYYCTIDPQQRFTITEQEDVYSEPNQLPQLVNFMDLNNIGDCNEIERALESMNLLEQQFMDNLTQYRGGVFIENESEPEFEPLNPVPESPEEILEDQSPQIKNEDLIHIPTKETINKSWTEPQDEVFTEPTVTFNQDIVKEKLIDIEGDNYDKTPADISNDSCYFHEFTDSEQTINSLRSAMDSLENIHRDESNEESIYIISNDNKGSSSLIMEPHKNMNCCLNRDDQVYPNEDKSMCFAGSTVVNNDLQSNEKQSSSYLNMSVIDDDFVVKIGNQEKENSKNVYIEETTLPEVTSPAELQASLKNEVMVSEEIQTTVNKRFNGTLKALIAKSAELQKPLNVASNHTNNNTIRRKIIKLPNEEDQSKTITTNEKSKVDSNRVPKNIQELKERLDTMHNLNIVDLQLYSEKKPTTKLKTQNKPPTSTTRSQKSVAPPVSKPATPNTPKKSNSVAKKYSSVESVVKKLIQSNKISADTKEMITTKPKSSLKDPRNVLKKQCNTLEKELGATTTPINKKTVPVPARKCTLAKEVKSVEARPNVISKKPRKPESRRNSLNSEVKPIYAKQSLQPKTENITKQIPLVVKNIKSIKTSSDNMKAIPEKLKCITGKKKEPIKNLPPRWK